MRYINRSSVDAHLERPKEERKTRDLAFGGMRKVVLTGNPPIIDQGEVVRLTKQVQDYAYENGRLKGSVEVYEKELGRLHTLIKDLVVQR